MILSLVTKKDTDHQLIDLFARLINRLIVNNPGVKSFSIANKKRRICLLIGTVGHTKIVG